MTTQAWPNNLGLDVLDNNGEIFAEVFYLSNTYGVRTFKDGSPDRYMPFAKTVNILGKEFPSGFDPIRAARLASQIGNPVEN